MIAISSTSSYGRMMIATFGYQNKNIFLWMMNCHFWLQTKIHLFMDDDCHFGYKQKFLFKKKSGLASFLPLRALPCVAPTLPCAYFSTRVALQSRHHSLSFPFLASSRSYTFSPHKPTIPPCVSNLISKLVLEAFPFPISKTYNLSWIFLFCLFACVCVCVCVFFV